MLKYDLDATPQTDGSEADATTLVQSLNEAQDRMAALCPTFFPALAFTPNPAIGGTIDFAPATGRRVVRVVDVCVDGIPLRTKRGTKAGPWSMAEFEDAFPHWRTDPPGRPLRWARVSDRAAVLHPVPEAGMPTTGHFVAAFCLPERLSAAAPSAECGLPEELHEWLAKLAACIEAQAVASEGYQFQKIALWEKGALEAAERKGAADRAARSPLGSTSGAARRDFMRV